MIKIPEDHKNETSSAFVIFQLEDETINLSISIDSLAITSYSLNVSSFSSALVYDSLLLASQDFFLNHMPIDLVNVEISASILESNDIQLRKFIQRLGAIYLKTNQMLLELRNSKLNFSDAQKFLIYNVDQQETLEKIYYSAHLVLPEIFIYRNFYSGFNVFTREWEPPRDLLSPADFIEFLVQHRIGRILTTNNIYLESMEELYSLYMLAIFKFIGVQLVTLDWDFYELSPSGVLRKAVFNYTGFPRYSAFPCHEGEWEKILGLTNVIQYPQSSHIKPQVEFVPLDSNYTLFIAAHTRLNNITSVVGLAHALASLEFTTDDNLFHDYQLWYHCIIYFMFHHYDASMQQKIALHGKLMNIYFNGISLLKYEVIESLKTERQITLFGDEKWDELFPQYYQKRHLPKNELLTMLKSGKYLHIHVNEHFSYFEPNPVIMDALAHGLPYIGFPPVVNIDEQKGFNHLEYRNIKELNQLTENVLGALNNSDYLTAANSYVNKMHGAWNTFINAVICKKDTPDVTLESYRQKHRDLFQEIAKHYISNNRQSLLNYLNFIKGGVSYDLAWSRFFEREYMQKIIRYYLDVARQ